MKSQAVTNEVFIIHAEVATKTNHNIMVALTEQSKLYLIR